MICKDCDREKPHHAKGLCKTCYQRLWRHKNPERVAACKRHWREKNPDYSRHWRAKNLTKVKAIKRRSYLKHREKELAYKRDYYRKNSSTYATWVICRRARKKKVANTLTPKQLEFERRIGEATYPGEKLHLHHLVSFSRDGGHTWGNIAFIPASLNLSIGDKLPQEVYQQLEL